MRCYLGGFPTRTTITEVQQLLDQFLSVNDIHLVPYKSLEGVPIQEKTEECRGFCFFTCSSEDFVGIQSKLESFSYIWKGSKIRMEEATPSFYQTRSVVSAERKKNLFQWVSPDSSLFGGVDKCIGNSSFLIKDKSSVISADQESKPETEYSTEAPASIRGLFTTCTVEEQEKVSMSQFGFLDEPPEQNFQQKDHIDLEPDNESEPVHEDLLERVQKDVNLEWMFNWPNPTVLPSLQGNQDIELLKANWRDFRFALRKICKKRTQDAKYRSKKKLSKSNPNKK